MFILDEKRPSDFFIWKANILINDNKAPLNLITELKQGRYLLETFQHPNSFIHFWILNDKYFFKHFKFSSLGDKSSSNLSVNLNDTHNMSKKIMYKCGSGKADNREIIKAIRKDFNTTNFQISNEQHRFIVSMLTESNNQLSESLKQANDYLFAIL